MIQIYSLIFGIETKQLFVWDLIRIMIQITSIMFIKSFIKPRKNSFKTEIPQIINSAIHIS